MLVLQAVIEVVYLFLLSKFIEECNRLLTDGAADSIRPMGSMRALHISLNNASTRTGRKCLKRNNNYLITLKIWME